MTKTVKKFTGIMLFIFLLLMTNCTTEETSKNEIDQHSSEAEIWFKDHQKDYNATVLGYIKELKWKDAITSNGDSGEVIEVPIILKDGLSVSNNTADLFNNHHRLMFIKNEQNEFNVFYVQFFTDQKNEKTLDENYNYYNLQDDFDGAVFIKELKTSIKSRLEFKNGERIKLASQTAKSDEKMCLYYGYWYDDGHFEPLVEMGCYGSPEGEIRDQPGYGGGGSGGGSGSGSTQTMGQKIVKKINTDKLDPCTNAVYQKLRTLKQANIAKMIERFNESGSIFNINMETGKVDVISDLAQTKAASAGSTDVNMVFSEDYIYGTGNVSTPTDLSVATTMAHEIIHAYLINLLEEYKSGGCSGICDFPTIYDAYVQLQINKDTNKNITVDRHHELIAEDYVYTIAETIQEFHTGQAVTSGFPQQVYLDMAWGGLQYTTIFNKTYPNDPANKNYKDRVRILGRINTEKLGSQYGINTPIGTPCKK